ncbi:MAG: hypothetical protein ACYDH9_20865, partial [Limisphaerales bacterium]
MEDGRYWRAAVAIPHPPSSVLSEAAMVIGLEHYLVVSLLLFSLGLFGVVARRNLLIIYMSF